MIMLKCTFKKSIKPLKTMSNEKLSDCIYLKVQSDLKSKYKYDVMSPPLNFLALLWHCGSKKFLLFQDLKMYIKYLVPCRD